jgi:RNA polymerase sigma-70 factor (ECF subfamily)
VQGAPALPASDLARQRQVVDAYLTAARSGDLRALLAVLDPGAVLRQGGDEIRGADAIAARAIKAGARSAQAALVDGAVGIIVAPAGRLRLVLQLTFVDGRIAVMDAIGDPEQLRRLDLAMLDRPHA